MSVIAGALLKAGFTVPQLFLAVGIANAIVAAYIFLLVPEYLLRFLAWILTLPAAGLIGGLCAIASKLVFGDG